MTRKTIGLVLCLVFGCAFPAHAMAGSVPPLKTLYAGDIHPTKESPPVRHGSQGIVVPGTLTDVYNSAGTITPTVILRAAGQTPPIKLYGAKHPLMATETREVSMYLVDREITGPLTKTQALAYAHAFYRSILKKYPRPRYNGDDDAYPPRIKVAVAVFFKNALPRDRQFIRGLRSLLPAACAPHISSCAPGAIRVQSQPVIDYMKEYLATSPEDYDWVVRKVARDPELIDSRGRIDVVSLIKVMETRDTTVRQHRQQALWLLDAYKQQHHKK